jgi:hypothetical protein
MGLARARIALPQTSKMTPAENWMSEEIIGPLLPLIEIQRDGSRELRPRLVWYLGGSSRRGLDEEWGRLACESRPSRRNGSRGEGAVVVVSRFLSSGSSPILASIPRRAELGFFYPGPDRSCDAVRTRPDQITHAANRSGLRPALRCVLGLLRWL